MNIESRIERLETSQEQPDERAIIEVRVKAMTREQRANRFTMLKAKLFATDICRAPEALAKRIEALKTKLLQKETANTQQIGQ